MGIDLITLNEYKAYAGIVTDKQDEVIKALIPKVSALVKGLCRRTFLDYVDDPKVQIYSGGDYLPLKEYPVLSIQSVEISTDYGNTYTPLVEYVDYALDAEDDRIVPVSTSAISPTVFRKLVNGYRVAYLAGYEDGLPPDLKLAVLDLVTYYIRNDAAVHSPKAPGTNSVQIEYITNTHLPAHIKRVLDLYAADYL